MIFKRKYNTPPLMRPKCSLVVIVTLLFWTGTASAQVSSPGPPLVSSAEKGDIYTVTRLLSSGIDINSVNGDGETALMLAAQENHEEIVTMLLTKGAQVNIESRFGQTALIYAAEKGYLGVVNELLKAGADWKIKDNEGADALLHAAYSGSLDTVRLFLDKGLDVNEATVNGKRTPLMMAAVKGSVDIVQELLNHHADMNATEAQGNTALAMAIINNRDAVTALLISHGAKLSPQDSEILFAASLKGSRSIMGKLLSAGADAKMKSASGETPLMFAINPSLSDEQSAKIVLMLVKAGADLNAADTHGQTALMSAVICGKPATTRVLIDNGADKDAHNSTTGATPLMLAVSNLVPFPGADKIGTIQALLDKGADIEAGNKLGRTALMEAAAHGTVAMVALLLAHGAKVSARDTLGKTALMQAAQQGQIEVTKRLLAHKADVNVKDHSGKTALAWTDGPIEITRTVFTISKPGEEPSPPDSSDLGDKQQLATIERSRRVVARLLKQSGAKQ